MSCKTIVGVRITPDSGDGLSCSSDEVTERYWSEGLSLFGFTYYWQSASWRRRSVTLKRDHSQCKLVYPWCRNTFVIEQEESASWRRDSQARFRENLRVKLPWVTRLEHWAVVQKAKTKLSTPLFLFRNRKRYQDPGLVYAYCAPVVKNTERQGQYKKSVLHYLCDHQNTFDKLARIVLAHRKHTQDLHKKEKK